MKIGIIGGTGLETFFSKGERKELNDNRTGISGYKSKEINGKEVIFIPRHGANHEFLPPNLNDKENIEQLYDDKVDKVILFSATGSLDMDTGLLEDKTIPYPQFQIR